MKTQFSHRRNSAYGALKVWLGFGVVGIVLVLLALIRIALPQMFVAMASPFWDLGTSLDAGFGGMFASFSDKAMLVKENIALAQEVSTLQNENTVLTARSQDLTTLLGGQANSAGAEGAGTASILAGVQARPPIAAYDTLIVSAGSSAGVTAGAEAFAQGGVPIGTVKSVTAHSSTIELFSNGGRSTDGWVGSSRTPLTLTGNGAGTFSASLPKGSPVVVGDSVYVSGPGALPIGTVISIDADPSSPTVVLHIQPLVNIFSLTWVQIAS
jgi:cell shape-determining protein MreC